MPITPSNDPCLKQDPSAIVIRSLLGIDIPMIVCAFLSHQWPKSASIFEAYLKEQDAKERLVWLGFYEQQFAGYVTLKWQSAYAPFKHQEIPEIMDLNVLPPYRNHGVGSALLDLAEAETAKRGDTVGLGVGLYEGYGSAQKLYVKRGYIPCGHPITYRYQPLEYGAQVLLDDDLVLWLTKTLR